tara:strand:- start:2879 stop:4687 length:1809 start_codon:yes stop_codon:yes gene_type:complete
MRVSSEELAEALEDRGWSPDDIYNLVAIANLESGFELDTLVWNSLDHSAGMFQLNLREEDGGAKRAFELGIVDTERVPTKAEVRAFLKGLDKEELLEFNLDVAEYVYKEAGNNFRLWSVHPDNKFFEKDSSDEYTAEVKKEKWLEGRAVAREALAEVGIESPLANLDQSYIDQNIPENLQGKLGSEIEFRLEEMMDEAETREEAAIIRKMILNERNRDPNQIGKFGENQGLDVTRPDRVVNLSDLGIELASAQTPNDPRPEEEIIVDDPNESGQFANPQQDLEESIESKKSKLDILMWEYLRGNPSVLVEHPITGEMVDLVALIEENPLGYEDNTPEMEQWIKSLYYQTDHYQDSEVGRADREYQWNSGGDSEDEWSTRRLDLISIQIEQLEQILGQANINLDDTQIWELAKQSYLQGLNLAEIKDFLVTATTDTGSPLFDFGAGAPAGGTISDFRSSINNLYRQYLMDPDEELLERRSRQLFTGETTLDLVEDEMIEQAALLFPAWKDRIEAGKSPLSIVSSYNGIFSSVMGYNPSWDGRHKDMAVQLGGLTVEGQDQMEMSGGDFARWLRQTDEYDQSPRGINNAYELVTGLGRLMGEVA